MQKIIDEASEPKKVTPEKKKERKGLPSIRKVDIKPPYYPTSMEDSVNHVKSTRTEETKSAEDKGDEQKEDKESN